MKKYTFVIVLGLVVLFFSCGSKLNLDSSSNKSKIEQELSEQSEIWKYFTISGIGFDTE